MSDRIVETFTAPASHRIDAVIYSSELLGPRALTVYASLAGVLAGMVGGDVAECGVASGDTASGMCTLMRRLAPEKRLHLCDTFGTCEIAGRNNLAAQAVSTHARSVADVLKVVGESFQDKVVCHVGLFSETLPAGFGKLCFLHADGDLYESTCEIIGMADRCVVSGGVVVFDDYGTEWTGVTRAVDEQLAPERWLTYAVAGYGQLVAVRRWE